VIIFIDKPHQTYINSVRIIDATHVMEDIYTGGCVMGCGLWDWGCMWEEGLEALQWRWVDWCVSVCVCDSVNSTMEM
jgi:hypothetical protein